MTIAARVYDYLYMEGMEYDMVPHPPTESAAESARASVVPLHHTAKAVMLRDGERALMAVIPADHQLNLRKLNKLVEGHYAFEHEDNICRMFDDCSEGAIPPLGQAYDIPVVYDDSLSADRDIYFEAGDHQEMIHLRGEQFLHLMRQQRHGDISRQHVGYPPTSAQMDYEYGL